jgi:hypothetical protein
VREHHGKLICGCLRGAKCDDPGKHPFTKRGFLDATKNVASIRGWWKHNPHFNIGIATGAISGIFVVDADGPTGLTTVSTLDFPPTLTALTGRVDGGKHFYFRHPGFPVKNDVKPLPGIDIRGDGGYVIAPGSRHISGNYYRWECDDD